jgi:hypothetical protein
MRKCSTALTTKEMQIKTTLRFYLTFIRMAIIKKENKQQMLEKKQGKGTLTHYWWECKLVQQLWKSEWRFLKETQNRTTYDPAMVRRFMGIYLKECRSTYKRGICTSMFTTALVTVVKLWN